MSLIICEINLILTCPTNCIITNQTGPGTFTITYTKLHVPIVTLSTQANAKLLQQFESNIEIRINSNKY